MDTALTVLDATLPANTKVKILTSKKGKSRLSITPLEKQSEPPNLLHLTAALVERWPMTNLLDILKETELRVGFTDAFRTVGTREVLDAGVLQRRLLLCLHGLGTNTGLKRMGNGGGGDNARICSMSGAAIFTRRPSAPPLRRSATRSSRYAIPPSGADDRVCE